MELAPAARNRGMPLEALRHDVTPAGLQPWLDEAVGTAAWTGTPLAGVLEEAGVRPDTVEIVCTGADHGIEGGEELDYARSLSVSEAMRPEILLACEMSGRPLEPQHGFPLRLLVPGWYGMTSVKWLSSIAAVTEPFRGFHQAVAYHYRRTEEDPGTPVRRIRPRALMSPPGLPDFPERRRYVDRGSVNLQGRAWSASAPIVRVEVGDRRGLARCEARRAGRRLGLAGLGVRVAGDARRPHAVVPGDGRDRRHPAAGAGLEPPGDGQQPAQRVDVTVR